MIARCKVCDICGDLVRVEGAKACAFCDRFGVRRSAVPTSTIRARVMFAIDDLHADIDDERAATRAWRDECRRARAWMRFFAIVGACGVLFGMLMLNALPSAQGATGRGMVDVRAERLLRAWCPATITRASCLGWMRVAQCETGGQQRSITYASLVQIRWRYNGRSGYDGALQFSPRTWRASVWRIPARRLTRVQYIERRAGAYAYAYGAPPAVQVLASDALRVRRDGGLGQWPDCGGRY